MTARPEPDAAAPPPPRASDTDRFATVRILQDAVARGQLTVDEAGERIAAAYAATHLRELPPLTADLPPVAELPPAEHRVTAPGWRPLASMAAHQVRITLSGLSRTGPPRRAAVVLLLVLAGLVAIGMLAIDGLFDGDVFDGDVFDGDGFDRDGFHRGGFDGDGFDD